MVTYRGFNIDLQGEDQCVTCCVLAPEIYLWKHQNNMRRLFFMLCMCIHVILAAYVLMKRMVDTYINKYFAIVAQEESSFTFFREFF